MYTYDKLFKNDQQRNNSPKTFFIMLFKETFPHLNLRLFLYCLVHVFLARGTRLWTYWNATWSTGLFDELQAVFGAIHQRAEGGKCWWCGYRQLPKHGEDGWKLSGTDTLVCSSFYLYCIVPCGLISVWHHNLSENVEWWLELLAIIIIIITNINI